MAILATPMTLSDPQDHAPVTGLLKCYFSYSCALMIRFQLK